MDMGAIQKKLHENELRIVKNEDKIEHHDKILTQISEDMHVIKEDVGKITKFVTDRKAVGAFLAGAGVLVAGVTGVGWTIIQIIKTLAP